MTPRKFHSSKKDTDSKTTDSKTNFVRYNPNLNEVTGSINASLLMDRLEHWFEVQKNKPFYKFTTPPAKKHAAYKVGDSWTEQLGFTKSEFDASFLKIGIKHQSKEKFEVEQHLKKQFMVKGKEMFYCSYYERLTHKVYYVRNHELMKRRFPKGIYYF